MYHYIESGLDKVYLANGYEITHDPDYGELVAIHNVEGLHKTIARHIATNSPRLDGKEVRFIRKYLDLSQVQLARQMKVGETTVRNWESGRSNISGSSDRLLRAMLLGIGVLEEIADLDMAGDHTDIRFSEQDEHWSAAA